MSRTADFDFTFERQVDAGGALNSLLGAGVLISRQGLISYVVDEDQMFNWRNVDGANLADIVRLLQSADPVETSVGVSIFLDDSETGGDLLFHPGRSTVSFMAEINRRNLSAESKFCDLGWYLRCLIPIFEPMGLTEVIARDVA